MNLTEWAHSQDIHVTTAYRWWREGTLPVPARKVGRLILVSTDTAAGPRAAGLYARVSSHDQEADLVGRLPGCRSGRSGRGSRWPGLRPRSGPE